LKLGDADERPLHALFRAQHAVCRATERLADHFQLPVSVLCSRCGSAGLVCRNNKYMPPKIELAAATIPTINMTLSVMD
jgi:hypothetical protein